ncbi:MAG: type II secretion system protein GspM [Burkholderiales bacterium]
MRPRQSRTFFLLSLFLLAAVSLLGGGAHYVWNKHRWAQTTVSQIEPRHARLLGLDAARSELEAALASAQSLKTQWAYPNTQDVNQAGNAAQQRVRDVLSASGLQVLSSQVLPPAAAKDKDWDRITLNVRTEGDALALYAALATMSTLTPVIVVQELDVQVQSQLPHAPPRLSMQFNLVATREPS